MHEFAYIEEAWASVEFCDYASYMGIALRSKHIFFLNYNIKLFKRITFM